MDGTTQIGQNTTVVPLTHWVRSTRDTEPPSTSPRPENMQSQRHLESAVVSNPPPTQIPPKHHPNATQTPILLRPNSAFESPQDLKGCVAPLGYPCSSAARSASSRLPTTCRMLVPPPLSQSLPQSTEEQHNIWISNVTGPGVYLLFGWWVVQSRGHEGWIQRLCIAHSGSRSPRTASAFSS